MPLPNELRGLMRDALKREEANKAEDRPLKRRKRGRKTPDIEEGEDSIDANSSVDSRGHSIERTPLKPTKKEEKQELHGIAVEKTPASKGVIDLEIMEVGDTSNFDDDDDEDDDDDDDDDDDEFEEVDLENVKPRASNLIGDVVVSYDKSKASESNSKKKSNRNVIGKEERAYRRQFHKSHIACMVLHGFVRNQWCNSEVILQKLRKLVSTEIYENLHPPKTVKLPAHRTRRLLDGLKQLMTKWISYYKVTSNKGIYKHGWYDWEHLKRSPTNYKRFEKCLVKGRGNRDIGAQGFVSLLRSVDVPSRLCYSLQPPDFTSNKIIVKPKSQERKKQSNSVKDRIVALRKGKVSNSSVSERPTQGEVDQKYPVWWAEVWDPAGKSWITIDPIVFQTIEVVKHKSKLEPPLSNPFNTLTYVIGYDRRSAVRDITMRYAEKYFSRTRKKRITKDAKDKEWFKTLLSSISKCPKNKADEFEDDFFNQKQEREGMPDNIQDFKNHPNFVLESHLRSNEILKPDEQPVGMIRIKGKNESLKVFRRSDVQTLRTARGWFQKGRVLKPGHSALRTKQKTAAQMMWRVDEDEETEERLYAEYQTDLYIPPPVSDDGLITKNAYGNIDVYVSSMIPKGAVHVKTEFCEDAAKRLGIDYAKAVVGFKFETRKATPKIEGIIVSEDLADSVEVVRKEIVAEEKEKQKLKFEIRALKGWELLLTKLKIRQRLNKSHGKIVDDSEEGAEVPEAATASDVESQNMEEEYEEYLKNDRTESENEEEQEEDFRLGEGGFIVDHNAGGFVAEPGNIIDEEDEGMGGGFLPEEKEDSISEDEYGGSEGADTGAGFLMDANTLDSENHDSESVQPDDLEDQAAGFDEYEAFMEELEKGENQDHAEDEEESTVDEQERHIEFTTHFGPETEAIESTEQDESKEGPTIEEFNEETGDKEAPYTIESTDEKTSEIISISDSDSSKPSPEPELKHAQSYDDEMEKQIKEQLKKESQDIFEPGTVENGKHTEDNDDFDFEYDSE